MKKHIILFSAIVMAASLVTGCGSKTSTSSSPISSSKVKADDLIEIDPFEDLDLKFFHQHNGEIREKDRGVYSETKCVKICDEHGCNMNYSFDMDDVKGDGESFPIKVVCTDISNPKSDEETINYVKDKYGILLTRTSMDMTAVFEEEPVEDCDPFEGITFEFVETELLDGSLYRYYNTNIKDCPGAYKISEHDCPLGYEAIYPDGKDENSLDEGDIIKYTILYNDGNTFYRGDEAKEKIDEYQWYRLNITRTEYETTFDLSNSSSSSETEESSEE